MSIVLPKSSIASLLREGGRFYRGQNEVVIRCIEACNGIAEATRSSYGPTGMNKVVVNGLEKLFVTNDGATILQELMVEHPAGKLMVMASKEQQREIGDGTNAVVILASALLENARQLLRMGLPVVAIVRGYEFVCSKLLEDLEKGMVVKTLDDLTNVQEVFDAIRPAILTKQYENCTHLTNLVVQACQQALPKNPKNFVVDNVRVCKVLGASVEASKILSGMAFKSSVPTEAKKFENVKVVAYSCPFDVPTTETTGKLGLSKAAELMQYAYGEEIGVEDLIKGLHASGVRVVVSGGKLGDLQVHYLNKYNMMGMKVGSKFELRRLCRSLGCHSLTRLRLPDPNQIGTCDRVYVDEIGSDELVFFEQEKIVGKVSTIIIRGSSQNVIDNAERAVYHGINNFRILTRDNRLLLGGGAVELELARLAEKHASNNPRIEQIAMERFATALTMLPKQLSENAGLRSRALLPTLRSLHLEGKSTYGFQISPSKSEIADILPLKIYDPFMTKYHAIKTAVEISIDILLIDQIVMSKPAEGPVPRSGPKTMDADD